MVVVDGDHIPGCFTLEGPKLHRRGDWYWIFAPAGGVATGWQAALRSRRKDWSPVNAATAAAWLTEQGLEVDCDWSFAMALISQGAPPA